MAVHVEPRGCPGSPSSASSEPGSSRYTFVGSGDHHRVSDPVDPDRPTVVGLLLPGLGVARRRETGPTR